MKYVTLCKFKVHIDIQNHKSKTKYLMIHGINYFI